MAEAHLSEQVQTPRSGRCSRRTNDSKSPDSFVCQTKYVVLQFLHQSTSDQNVLHSSLSSTSESDYYPQSRSEELCKQWQKTAASTLKKHPRTVPKTVINVNTTAPPVDCIDGNDNLAALPSGKDKNQCNPKHSFSPGASGGRRWISRPLRKKTKQNTAESNLMRSGSQITDTCQITGTCEAEIYHSDADDELDASFDSNYHGSTTSASFKNRLANHEFHQQMLSHRLSTLENEAESVADVNLHVAEDSLPHTADEETASSILSLDMINLEYHAVSPTAVYAHVTDYLVQIDDATFQDSYLEEDGFNGSSFTSPPVASSSLVDCRPRDAPQQVDVGTLSEGFDFELGESFDDRPLGAYGRMNEIGAARGNRSKLTLDLVPLQDSEPFIDAVRSLQHEIDEELSSFESEFEEVLLFSDRSISPGRGQNRFPLDTAEAARILAQIGDEVQERHFAHLNKAVGQLFIANCAGFFTYDNFYSAAKMSLDGEMTGWAQVAALLLYSRQVTLQLAHSGRQGAHRVIDYTVRLLCDVAFDFISGEGGWARLSAIEQTNSPSSPDCPDSVLNPYLGLLDIVSQLPSATSENLSAADLDSSGLDLIAPQQSLNMTVVKASDVTIMEEDSSSQVSFVDPEVTFMCMTAPVAATVGLQSAAYVKKERTNTTGVEEETETGLEAEALCSGTFAHTENQEVIGNGVRNFEDAVQKESPKEDGDRDREQSKEDNESRGVMIAVRDAVRSSNLFACCAVSVGMLAVGAAVAFIRIRN